MKRHAEDASASRSLRCSLCYRRFHSHTSLQRHQQEAHPSPLRCRKCGKVVRSQFEHYYTCM